MKYLIVLGSLLFLFSCNKGPCENAEKAKFKDMTGFDGCGMMIELQDGKRLEPVNLGDYELQPEDGKKIWVEYELFNGASICMSGDIVKITCISERK